MTYSYTYVKTHTKIQKKKKADLYSIKQMYYWAGRCSGNT